MPVSESEIRSLMRECGVTPGPSLGSTTVCILEGLDRKLLFTVDITKNTILQFRTLEMMSAGPTQHRPVLYKALMSLNYQKKLAKFCFDRSAGAVVAYVDLFVGDTKLTKQQVQRCVNVFRTVVIPAWKRFEAIVETGTDPGDSNGAEQLRDMLAELIAAATESESKKTTPQQVRKISKPKKDNFDQLLGDVLGDD